MLSSLLFNAGRPVGRGPLVAGGLLLAILVSFHALGAADKSLTLSWRDKADNETGYLIERRVRNSGDYRQIDLLAANAQRYVDSGLTRGTSYCYRIRAVNASGTSAALEQCEPQFERRTLQWSDNADNEVGFRIERRSLGETEFRTIATVPADVTFYVDPELPVGGGYCYRVIAFNAVGESTAAGSCDPSSGWRYLDWPPPTNEADYLLVERRAGLTGSYRELARFDGRQIGFVDDEREAGLNYCYRIRSVDSRGVFTVKEYCEGVEHPLQLAWHDNADNEDGFIVERREGDGHYREVARLAGDVTDYLDYGVEDDQAYCYLIRAFNRAGQSAPVERCYDRRAPVTLALSWLAAPVAAEGYLVMRRAVTEQGFALLDTLDGERLSFEDSGRQPGINYCYQVMAMAGEQRLVVVQHCDGGDPSPVLSWRDNADNELGFVIERRGISDTAYREIARVAANITNFSDLQAGGEACYRIRAFNEAGQSAAAEQCPATQRAARGENMQHPVAALTAVAAAKEHQGPTAFDANATSAAGVDNDLLPGPVDEQPTRAALPALTPTDNCRPLAVQPAGAVKAISCPVADPLQPRLVELGLREHLTAVNLISSYEEASSLTIGMPEYRATDDSLRVDSEGGYCFLTAGSLQDCGYIAMAITPENRLRLPLEVGGEAQWVRLYLRIAAQGAHETRFRLRVGTQVYNFAVPSGELAADLMLDLEIGTSVIVQLQPGDEQAEQGYFGLSAVMVLPPDS